MEDTLNFDNILGTEEIENLFVEEETQDTSPEEKEVKEETNETENDKQTTEDVNADTLFADTPESVGSEEEENNIKEQEEPSSTESNGTSPKNNFYSSIAKALQEEGIFPDLDDDSIKQATTAEQFRTLIDKQIQAGLEERQKRINEALDAGVETTEIRKYENAINYLNSIKDEHLTDESDKGENLRKQLIYQDFINRGYTKERAIREVNKSFNAGTDIDDAKEALNSNKEYFEESYNNMINEAKKEEEQYKQHFKEQENQLKKALLEDKEVLGDIVLDKSTRQKALDVISKPVYKDPDTGEYLTAIQKYERENRVEFLKNLGVIYTLTNGFKDINNLIKGKVNKEVKKGLKDLENVINSTSRTADGNLKFVSGINDDPESNFNDWKIDI